MIGTILLSLFATALSLTCEEQFNEIEFISINKKISLYGGNVECGGCCLCDKYILYDRVLIPIEDNCYNLHISDFTSRGEYCDVGIKHNGSNNEYFVFINGDINIMRQEGITSTGCFYEYSVKVKIQTTIPPTNFPTPSHIRLIVSIVLLIISIVILMIVIIIIHWKINALF